MKGPRGDDIRGRYGPRSSAPSRPVLRATCSRTPSTRNCCKRSGPSTPGSEVFRPRSRSRSPSIMSDETQNSGRSGCVASHRRREREQGDWDQLRITEDTVKGRVKSILAKLDANDRTHAAIIGLKRGIIDLSSVEQRAGPAAYLSPQTLKSHSYDPVWGWQLRRHDE